MGGLAWSVCRCKPHVQHTNSMPVSSPWLPPRNCSIVPSDILLHYYAGASVLICFVNCLTQYAQSDPNRCDIIKHCFKQCLLSDRRTISVADTISFPQA